MTTKKVKKKKEQLDFTDTHRNFTGNLDSLEVFIKNVAPIAEKHDQAAKKKMDKFAKQMFKIFGLPKGKIDKSKRK